MACCAFAVFLLLNLLAPLGWLRRFAGSRTPRANAAVAWRPDQAGVRAERVPSPRRWRRAVVGAVAVELLALLALGMYWLIPGQPSGLEGPRTAKEWDAFIALHTPWCGTDDAPTPSGFTLAERRP